MDRAESGTVTLTLPADAALVLDALVADLNELGAVPIEGPAELQAMWELSAALERTLVETFRPDYKQLLEDARTRLAAKHG